MTVYFIGAGPGAKDLMTVRGAAAIARAGMVLYAGSLVSRDMLGYCKPDAEIHDTAELDLDAQESLYRKALEMGWDVARLHSGDPAIYGATAEQMRRLEKLGIPYEIVPGVSSFTAAAAVLGAELTKPHVSQTIIITRSTGRASPMPEGEQLAALAAHGATMAVFLSGARMDETLEELMSVLPSDTPAALVHKATWPQQRHLSGTLASLAREVSPEEWRLSTMLLVGRVLDGGDAPESCLYSKNYSHRHRKSEA